MCIYTTLCNHVIGVRRFFLGLVLLQLGMVLLCITEKQQRQSRPERTQHGAHTFHYNVRVSPLSSSCILLLIFLFLPLLGGGSPFLASSTSPVLPEASHGVLGEHTIRRSDNTNNESLVRNTARKSVVILRVKVLLHLGLVGWTDGRSVGSLSRLSAIARSGARGFLCE